MHFIPGMNPDAGKGGILGMQSGRGSQEGGTPVPEFSARPKELKQQAEALVDLALQNGGRDNVTALAIRVEKTPGLGFCRLWNGKGKQG